MPRSPIPTIIGSSRWNYAHASGTVLQQSCMKRNWNANGVQRNFDIKSIGLKTNFWYLLYLSLSVFCSEDCICVLLYCVLFTNYRFQIFSLSEKIEKKIIKGSGRSKCRAWSLLDVALNLCTWPQKSWIMETSLFLSISVMDTNSKILSWICVIWCPSC